MEKVIKNGFNFDILENKVIVISFNDHLCG